MSYQSPSLIREKLEDYMRKMLFPALAALALAGCGTASSSLSSIPAAPVDVANKTILDEKVGIAIETAYKAFRLAVELAVDTGKLKGAKAAQVAALDSKAFAATVASQNAYKALNNESYIAAASEARAAIEQGIALMRSN